MKPPTIKDVSRRAGVSTATVSRVINRTTFVEPETERRVAAAMEALGYRRNVHWERLKRKSSQMVCFLLGNRPMPNSMHVRMLMGAERTLAQAGFDLVFAAFRYNEKTPSKRLELPRLLQSRGVVDGAILGGIHYQNLFDALDQLPMPSVLFGNTGYGSKERLSIDTVLSDDVSAVNEATQYLIKLGHERIAFIGNSALPWFERRHRGYLTALKEARLKPIAITAPWNLEYVDYGLRAMQSLLGDKSRPTAIVAGNDDIAGGVWKALLARGISIPRDMSVIGFGDRREVAMLEPALTTITSFPEVVGAECAQMLLEKLRQPGLVLPARTVRCEMIERASCAPPADAASAPESASTDRSMSAVSTPTALPAGAAPQRVLRRV